MLGKDSHNAAPCYYRLYGIVYYAVASMSRMHRPINIATAYKIHQEKDARKRQAAAVANWDRQALQNVKMSMTMCGCEVPVRS